ncbi:MAG: DUF3558 domain-containing protein [Pseudonocardia sp.]|nr:DUF3558 domain-containing protein [Pseudonocardia sp.]
MRRLGWLLVGVLACLTLAGCVRESPGAAAPAVDPESATTVERAPRPRDVAVADLDPCSLLTAAQRVDLQLDGEPIFNGGRSALYQGPESTCNIGAFEPRAVAVGVSLPYDGLGIDAFAPYRVDSLVTPLTIEGFPALQAVPARLDNFCSVVVDLGPGAALSIQYRDGGRIPAVPQPDLCAGAVDVARAAMATLVTLA